MAKSEEVSDKDGGGAGAESLGRGRQTIIANVRQAALARLRLQLLFVPRDKSSHCHDDRDHDHAQRNADRGGKLHQRFAEQVGSDAIDPNPRDRASHVCYNEARPRHAIGPGQDSGHAAQHRNEAREKDNFAAVS